MEPWDHAKAAVREGQGRRARETGSGLGGELDLDAGAARQRRDQHRRARRLVGAEALRVDRVQLAEVVEVGDKHRCLHHVVEARPGLAEDGRQVSKTLLGLRFAPRSHLAGERQRQLARGEDPVFDVDR
jgi:hypothetical protein